MKIIKNKNFGKLGFTLIELLIVIAIIGLLSSVVLASLNTARKKARDARRMADFNEIRKALELYYDKKGRYPDPSHNGCYDGWETTCDTVGNFIDELRTEGFLSKVPFDPINISTAYGVGYFYGYYRYSSGTNGCNFVHAVLAIKQFEMSNNPNKGISAKCDPAPPNRNWYPEWDYSVLMPE